LPLPVACGDLLKGFAYQKEESYAAFSKGDKIASYGLTGLPWYEVGQLC